MCPGKSWHLVPGGEAAGLEQVLGERAGGRVEERAEPGQTLQGPMSSQRIRILS